MHTAYTIELSIKKDLKLKKRKGNDKQQREKLYTICHGTWAVAIKRRYSRSLQDVAQSIVRVEGVRR